MAESPESKSPVDKPVDQAVDKIVRLDYAERWFGDAFREIDPPGGFASVDVDVTVAQKLVDTLRAKNVPATLNHVFVRAASQVLFASPDLHILVAGNRRLHPAQVDIGLSVGGETSFAPVMVIENSSGKSVEALSLEVARRIPEIREKEQKDLAFMRRIGALIPFSFLRRLIVRWLLRSTRFRRKLSGTFQVSCLTTDVVVPFLFNTAATLGVGRARDRVVPISGLPAIRPIVTITCAIDHKVWDGVRAAKLLLWIKKLVEAGEVS